MGVLDSGAEQSIWPFISGINGLDLVQAMDCSELYALRFNPSRPCRNDVWMPLDRRNEAKAKNF